MPTAKITKRSVDAAPVGAFLWDDELRGFGLRVTANGARSYVYQYRMGGREAKTQRYTLGKHGTLTPDLARAEARRLAVLVGRGINPSDSDRERRRQQAELGFADYIDHFAVQYLEARWRRSEAAKRLLKREGKSLGNKALPLIRKADISAVLDSASDRPAVARSLFSTLRKLFRWAVSRGDIERSPMEGMEAPAPVAARDRVLTDHELKVIWQAIGEIGQPFDRLYRLLILTGQRRDEVAGMRWSELDRSSATWTLPGERTKNGEAHLVPLSPQAVSQVDLVASGKKWPSEGMLFSTTGKTTVSGFSKAKRRLDDEIALKLTPAKSPMPPWRIHDLRRTVATGLQRLGVRFEVTEAVLNHVSGSRGGVAGVYQRHDWAKEKRLALGRWGKYVERLAVADK